MSCLSSLDDGALKCQVCGGLHPGDFPNVCLDLDHFIEDYFPAEYDLRREKIKLLKGECNQGSSSGKLISHGVFSYIPYWYSILKLRKRSYYFFRSNFLTIGRCCLCEVFLAYGVALSSAWRDWRLEQDSVKLFKLSPSITFKMLSLFFLQVMWRFTLKITMIISSTY